VSESSGSSRRTAIRVGLAVVAVAAAAGGIMALDDVLDDDSGPNVTAPPSTAPDERESRPVETAPWDDRISKAEFDRLSVGMTVQEAGATVGGAGEVVFEQGELGEPGHRVVVRWSGATPGSYAEATFSDGRLVSVEQRSL